MTRDVRLQTPADAADWEGALWDTVAHLQTVIRIDTVNPPGNEIGVARYLDDVMRGAGIATTLLEPARGRAALIGRIPGDGSKRPLLLMAHMDVVGVEREKWSTNPFGGEVLDGFVYGRGAIDDKGMLATNLQAMLLAQRQVDAGKRLARDIVFLATSDEEAGGEFGIDWVLDNHKALIDAEFALNEGGRIRVADGRPLYCAVQCAEKVPHNVVVTAFGTGGHASVPHDGNALVRLALALARIDAHDEPLAVSDVTRRFFGELSTVWPNAAVRGAMADVASDVADRVVLGARELKRVPSFDAVLRNGISPTMISGGTRSNVIPTECSATLNIRTLPGASIDEVVARLKKAVADPEVRFTVRSSGVDGPASPASSEMFSTIAAVVGRLDPAILTVPYLSTGATDAAVLRKAGIAAYGLLPFPLTQDDEDRMHGHDERVSIESIGFGMRLTVGIVNDMAFHPVAAA